MLRDLRIKGSEPLFLEAGGFRLELHLRGVVPNCADLALGRALWSFVRRVFWVFHLVPLQRAALLAPAIISALGLGVVVGVSTPAHRADEPMLCEQLAVSLAGILRTSIRVMDTAPGRLPGSNSGLQCCNCQTCVDRAADRISDPMAMYVMSATQSWFGPSTIRSRARSGKMGPSWSLSVVATNRLRRLGCRSCSRMRRRIFLELTRMPRWRSSAPTRR